MKKWYYRLSLRRRLWISFLILTVLSIALTGMMSYWIAFRSTEQEAFISSQNTLNKSARVLDEKLRHIIVTTSTMMLSDSFKLAMDDVYSNRSGSYYTRLSSMQTPLGQMKLIEPSIQSVLIYTPVGELYATTDLRNSQTRFKETIFSRYLDSPERVIWVEDHVDQLFSGNQRVISLIMKPITEVNVQDVYVVVNVKEDAIHKVVTDDLFDRADNYFLISRSGEAVLPLSIQTSSFQRDPAFMKLLQGQDRGFFKYNMGGDPYLVNYSRLTMVDNWTMVSTQTQSDLLRQVNRIKTTTLWIMLCCVILAFVLSNVISSLLLKPLHKLQGLMKRVEQNNLDVRFTSKYEDEVTQVGLKFNRMLEEISSLIEDVKEAEYEKRKMEVKALQAQIDPHFLYNTLNTIIWKSEASQNQDVTEMITSLSLLFQLGLNGGNEMTTLAKEIDHVRQYLNLQQKCYEGLFDYTIELEDDSLLEKPILKIILQPLVENSILHGFQEMEGMGIIRISITCLNDSLRLRVEDNGAGMDVQTVKADMRIEQSFKKSYALRNVYGRLRLHYGNEADIDLNSEPNISTSVTLTIPLAGEGYNDDDRT
ncbi:MULTISPECIES: sensor histidine kinase [unclassified Paenibacillus]|uniref:sensor histidine kinase n=1 Tax=unclassified Paenibacillus TaxID=185978 RepID=UPI0027898F36|nr:MULTISPECIES: sensor histidine kinase [unclassified Paenibacillus]MDQ0900625.1 two-component system sensor histidine kinase YesM [Paenibacillus sp. V4I7]MDQ0920867.1 two-component system sensor histidine kinase YesM [Paenibacillus sp. V4I5]